MIATYDPVFVVLSVVVAVLGSYAALDLAGRMRSEHGSMREGWIAAAATVLGLGIWSMHFVGMLAFRLPVAVWFDGPLMLLSMLVAVGASLLALIIVSRSHVSAATFVPGAVVMGLAIAGMHYIGMASMRAHMRLAYDTATVVASVLIAIGASGLALWLAFSFRAGQPPRGWVKKGLGALLMGAGISGMHYTAMYAARFAPGQAPPASVMGVDATSGLATAVAAVTLLIAALAMIGAVIDRTLQARATFTRELAERTALLAKSEQQYRLIVDTALDAVVTMGSSGVITDWNPQAEKIFGWSKSEAVGQRLSATIIPPRYRDAHERGLRRFFETGEGPVLNTRIEITAIRRDGEEFPVELAISPAKLGSDWTFSGFIRDLSEKVRAADAVRAGEARYRELFEDVPVGLYRSTPEGRLVDVNPAMVAMLGYRDREALLGTPATALYVDRADRERWAAEMIRNGFLRNFDVHMLRADGRKIWARETTHAKRGVDGTILLYEGVIEDITERVEGEQRLRASEEQLRQALKMEAVGQLAGGVAHDFNNLLTVILSYASMLTERIGAGDPNRDDVKEISAAAERAAGLTRQLLAFSRKQVMQPRVLNVNTVVGDLENMLRRLIGEDIELRTSYDPDVGHIEADPGQLEQVLMNLVLNARDAMPTGGRLTIATSNAEAEQGGQLRDARGCVGDYVMLTVADTGVGMTPEVQHRLFDPFFTTKVQGQGTGLGLSTAYGIVKQSGGEIVVESSIGRGTTFRVCFPRLRRVVDEARTDAPPAEVPGGTETLLLVEDEDIVRSLAVRVLRKYGYQVLPAASGAEALEIAKDPTVAIDGVVTDVVMPEMNGRELVEQLARSRPELKVLFMSGYTNDDVLRRGVYQGEAAFLQKPFTPAEMARKVREVLDGSAARTPHGELARREAEESRTKGRADRGDGS